MKIDMRYLYGRDVGQILNIYDFAPDTYFSRGTFEVTGVPTNIIEEYISYAWMGDKIGSAVHVWQQRADGTYNVIGELSDTTKTSNSILSNLKSHNAVIDPALDLTFTAKGAYDRTYVISNSDFTAATVTYDVDDVGRKLLRDDNSLWSGTFIGKSYRNPFVYLSNGDKIRVEGEEGFRSIKRLPVITTSKDGRDGEPLSDDAFGAVSVESYTGITRGEGLAVIARIENGSVVSLEWNQRSYDPLTQPTAYQYFTPPVLKFIPKNGSGGGARANVLVSKGQVISVDLIDGGSGYTEAPQVIVSRRFDILSERDIGVSLINIGVNPYVETAGMNVISTIDVLGNQVSGINTFTSILFNSPVDSVRKITAQIQLVEEAGDELEREALELVSNYNTSADQVQVIDVLSQPTVLSAQIQDVIATNSISTVSKQITSVVHNIIQNTSLSNINYFEVAALLQVDLDPNDTVVYIADTSKFKTAGFLLIGNEVVAYLKKLSDRFLMVQRGENGTTPQFWPAGTYIRQIPETVSIAPGGITTIESESDVSMVSVPSGTSTASLERDFSLLAPPHQMNVTRVVKQEINPELYINSISTVSSSAFSSFSVPFDIVPSVTVSTQRSIVNAQIQTIQSEFTVTKNQLEVLLITPPSGIVDGYEEQVFITDPVIQRNGNAVDLIDIGGQYFVTQRNLTEVLVTNSVFGIQAQYIGSYEKTNLGHTISHYDGIFDDGTANASGLTLLEFSTYFPSMTIRDFTLRSKSSYTLSGAKFNLMPPSIQNPVTISSSTGTIGGPIVVQNTNYFPVSGYLYTSGGTVIEYTGKTSTSFTGCTLVNGPDAITTGDEIIPFAIS
jgi:hypothetical protein